MSKWPEETFCHCCGESMGKQTGYVKKACSDECRSKLRSVSISRSKKGVKLTEEHRKALSGAANRRWSDPEQRRLSSEKQLENWSDPEYRESQIRSQTGHSWEMTEARKRACDNWVMTEKRKAYYERQRNTTPVLRAVGPYILRAYEYGHPLADKTGRVLEHRKVLYDKIGPGPHPCHWCSVILDWGGVEGICTDHLDGDGSNNDPSNLVPSCSVCNRLRGVEGNPTEWRRNGQVA